jgi:hypothetical protein
MISRTLLVVIVEAVIRPPVPMVIIVVSARGWRWIESVAFESRSIGHRPGLRFIPTWRRWWLPRSFIVTARSADHAGQYRTHCRPGNNWHDHVALIGGCHTSTRQAT